MEEILIGKHKETAKFPSEKGIHRIIN